LERRVSLDRWGDERHRLGLTPILGARDFLGGARRTSDGHVYLANLRQLDGGRSPNRSPPTCRDNIKGCAGSRYKAVAISLVDQYASRVGATAWH
jgi:hypothetical protein